MGRITRGPPCRTRSQDETTSSQVFVRWRMRRRVSLPVVLSPLVQRGRRRPRAKGGVFAFAPTFIVNGVSIFVLPRASKFLGPTLKAASSVPRSLFSAKQCPHLQCCWSWPKAGRGSSSSSSQPNRIIRISTIYNKSTTTPAAAAFSVEQFYIMHALKNCSTV
jgi:hypothetical protein